MPSLQPGSRWSFPWCDQNPPEPDGLRLARASCFKGDSGNLSLFDVAMKKWLGILALLCVLVGVAILSVKPSPMDIIAQIVAQRGELGSLAFADCPEGLRSFSRTRIPTAVDWDQVEDIWFGGLGASNIESYRDGEGSWLMSDHASKAQGSRWRDYPVGIYKAHFRLIMKDGTVHIGTLCLRPAASGESVDWLDLPSWRDSPWHGPVWKVIPPPDYFRGVGWLDSDRSVLASYRKGKEDGLWEYARHVRVEKRRKRVEQIYKTVTWQDGKKEGPTTYYDDEGNVTKTESYENGELVK